MSSGLGRDARWSMGIVLARSIGSLLFVVVASRRLGSESFGSLAALSALTSLANVFVSNGLGHVVTMRSARSDGACAGLLRTSVRVAAVLALVVTPLYFFVAVAVLGIPLLAASALLVADVFVGGIAELISSVFIGLRKFRSAFLVLGAPSLARLVASIAIVGFAFDSVVSVCLVAAVCALLALIPILSIGSKVTRSGGDRLPLRPLLRASWVFISGNVVMRFNNDFDKLLLPAQLGAVTSVGSYALGYRLVEYSLLPLAALSTAAYPRLFRAGERAGREMRVLGRLLLRSYLAAGAIVAVGLLLVRHHLDLVFGSSYNELSIVIGLLAGYPVVKSLTNAVSEPLTGAGHHRYRVMAGGCATIVTIVVSVSLLPVWGWKAAVAATYAAEVTQLVLVSLFARRVARRTIGAEHMERLYVDQVGDERDTAFSNTAR